MKPNVKNYANSVCQTFYRVETILCLVIKDGIYKNR